MLVRNYLAYEHLDEIKGDFNILTIKSNEMGSICNMHMGDDKCIHNSNRMGDSGANVREV
jgi:hypothetical protein